MWCQMFCYHVVVKSCCLVLPVEIRLTVVVLRVPSASVVGIVPPFLQREFLILHTQHFLEKTKVCTFQNQPQGTAQIHQKSGSANHFKDFFLNLSRYYINDTLLPSTVLVKDHCMSLHLLSKSTKLNLQLSRSFNDMKKNCQSNEE